MSLTKPTTAEEWLSFLQSFNRDLLERIDPALEAYLRESGVSLERVLADYKVTDEVRASGWLGYPPAKQDDLAHLEKRLGIHLPPSYRELLCASNGFRMPQMLVPRLRPTGEVQWFRTENQSTIDILKPFGDDLSNMLQISDRERAGTAVYLLDPDTVAAGGEWQAVRYAHWDAPNCRKYASLWEMLQQDYRFSVLWCPRGSGALSRHEDVQAIFAKLPALIAQFDREIKALHEDPYMGAPAWRDKVLGILQTARTRVTNLIEDPRTAPVTLHHLQTLFTEFNQRAQERTRIEYPGGGYSEFIDQEVQQGWHLAAKIIAWFLHGRMSN